MLPAACVQCINHKFNRDDKSHAPTDVFEVVEQNSRASAMNKETKAKQAKDEEKKSQFVLHSR